MTTGVDGEMLDERENDDESYIDDVNGGSGKRVWKS